MKQYSLSKKAESDLEGILIYTLDRWGEEQAERYLQDLTDCFNLIAHNPGLGRTCEALFPNLKRIEQGRHVLFYRVEEKQVVIVRVLHQSRLPQRHEFMDI